jgi:hypothetical protein
MLSYRALFAPSGGRVYYKRLCRKPDTLPFTKPELNGGLGTSNARFPASKRLHVVAKINHNTFYCDQYTEVSGSTLKFEIAMLSG